MAVDIFLIDWERPKPGQETNKVGNTSVTGRVISEGTTFNLVQSSINLKKITVHKFPNNILVLKTWMCL